MALPLKATSRHLHLWLYFEGNYEAPTLWPASPLLGAEGPTVSGNSVAPTLGGCPGNVHTDHVMQDPWELQAKRVQGSVCLPSLPWSMRGGSWVVGGFQTWFGMQSFWEPQYTQQKRQSCFGSITLPSANSGPYCHMEPSLKSGR